MAVSTAYVGMTVHRTSETAAYSGLGNPLPIETPKGGRTSQSGMVVSQMDVMGSHYLSLPKGFLPNL